MHSSELSHRQRDQQHRHRKYLWEDLTTLLAVYDKDDNLIYRFEYADGRMPVSMTDKEGNRYYLHYDQVGSLRAVSDSSHNIVKEITYDTYGNIINDTNPSFKVSFGFAGGLYDSDTKLTHFGFREYDAFTGKWTAKDPLLFGGGDSNLYGYVLGDPVDLVDPWGLMWGDQYGQEALEYWVNKELTTGNKLYLIPEFFAALWTPDTSDKTFDTLTFCYGGFLYQTPKVLYHFTTKEASKQILKEGLSVGSNNLYGAGVYATRFNNRFIAKIQGAASTEARIIINDTSLFKPTLFPGTFKTPGIDVPASCLCK